jgi:hypothetical protein
LEHYLLRTLLRADVMAFSNSYSTIAFSYPRLKSLLLMVAETAWESIDVASRVTKGVLSFLPKIIMAAFRR